MRLIVASSTLKERQGNKYQQQRKNRKGHGELSKSLLTLRSLEIPSFFFARFFILFCSFCLDKPLGFVQLS